jgi:uncharacterized membrane protein YcaP (DUF421 family)
MSYWTEMDWVRAFAPEMTLPEVLIRGTVVYVSLVLLLRVILKRQAGRLSISDLLVVTLIAGVCRNPLVRDSYSITDGLLVVIVILLWSYAMDWLSYYVPVMHTLLHPPAVQLIRDGIVLKDNLQRELITEQQLQSRLRHVGVKEPSLVDEAYIEGNGQMSVIRKDPKSDPSGSGGREHASV